MLQIILLILAGAGGFVTNLLVPAPGDFKRGMYFILGTLLFLLAPIGAEQLFQHLCLTAGGGAACAELLPERWRTWIQNL